MSEVKVPSHLPEDVGRVWVEVVTAWGESAAEVEGPELEAFAGQVARLRDAQRRLAAEGIVVEDPKGQPIPHPAIAVERAAQEQIRAWGDRFRPRRPRGGRRG